MVKRATRLKMDTDIKYIYTLTCPLSQQVRYVGKSCDPFLRLKQHMNPSLGNERMIEWVLILRKYFLTPEISIIEVCNSKGSSLIESMYIGLFKSWGFDLFNIVYNVKNKTNKNTLSDLNTNYNKQLSLRRAIKEIFPSKRKQAVKIGMDYLKYNNFLNNEGIILSKDVSLIEAFIESENNNPELIK